MSYVVETDAEPIADADEEAPVPDADELIDAELLIEEISIDGMCGVY